MINSMKKFMVETTVKCMLNPKNDTFFIEKLTSEKIKKLLTGMPNDAIDCFYTAFDIANHAYYIHATEEFEIDQASVPQCPVCGLTASSGYHPDCKCPNCDYED